MMGHKIRFYGYIWIIVLKLSQLPLLIWSTANTYGAPVAQWVKRWPTDLADRVRSSLEVKSSQP